jgi:integrase
LGKKLGKKRGLPAARKGGMMVTEAIIMAGTGHVEKRADGVYRLAVSAGRKPGGGYILHRRTVKAENLKDAEEQLARFVVEVKDKGAPLDHRMTLRAWLDAWLRDVGTTLAPRTLYRYAQQASRIDGRFGAIPLAKLRPIDVDAWLRWLASCRRTDGKAGGLSPRTVRHHYRMLATVLQRAVDLEVIPSNPSRKVQPPRVERIPARCYDEETVRRMLAALEGEKSLNLKAFLLVAVSTGARRGEIAGMRWGDVDFDRALWRVRRSFSYVPGKPLMVKEPKTASSVRPVALPSGVVAALRELRERQAADIAAAGDLWPPNTDGWCFLTNTGRLVHPDFWSNAWGRFVKRHGLPPLGVHGLRHTAATLLIAAGIPARTVAGRLGHSSVSTTTDIYAHHLVSADRTASDWFEGIVKGKG